MLPSASPVECSANDALGAVRVMRIGLPRSLCGSGMGNGVPTKRPSVLSRTSMKSMLTCRLRSSQRRVERMKQINRAEPAIQVEFLPQVDLRGHFDAVGPPHIRQSHGAQQNRIKIGQTVEGACRKGIS